MGYVYVTHLCKDERYKKQSSHSPMNVVNKSLF